MKRLRVVPPTAVLGLLLSLAAGPARGQTAQQKADLARYQQQLLAWFSAADLNHDGYLDKVELARAFRGPAALPYDAKPKAAPARGTVQPASLVLMSWPLPPTPLNYPVAELLSWRRGGKTAPRPVDITALPDYQLLSLLGKRDRNGQPRVSRRAFNSWVKKNVRQVAKQLKAQQYVQKAQAKVQQATQKLQAAQAKLQQAKTARSVQSAQKEVQRRLKDLAKAEAALQKRQQALNELTSQVGPLSAALGQAPAPAP
jgi:hypothetical protein